MDPQKILTEFDRHFAAALKPHTHTHGRRGEEYTTHDDGWDPETTVDVHFFNWLDGRFKLDDPDRDAAVAAYEARRTERDRAAASRTDLIDRVRDAHGDTAAWAFTEFFDRHGHEFGNAGDEGAWQTWQADYVTEQERIAELDRRAREQQAAAEATAKAEREAAEAGRKDAERIAREERAAEVAAELATHLADPAWVRAEDPASLRAVAAWWLHQDENGDNTYAPNPGPATDLLDAAVTTLDTERADHLDAIRAAQVTNADLTRVARGESPVDVPAPFDLTPLIDVDAVGRWLAAHRDWKRLTLGWIGEEEIRERDKDGNIVGTGEFADAAHWSSDAGAIIAAGARWRVVDEITREAQAHPETAADLRALARRVAAATIRVGVSARWLDASASLDIHGRPDLPAAIIDRLDSKVRAWGAKTCPRPARSTRPTAADLLPGEDVTAPPVPVLPFLAYPGCLTVFGAKQKNGKSTLLGGGVGALTRGAPWLGVPTTAGRVLWFYEESDRDWKARLVLFGADLTRVVPVRLPLAPAAERDRIVAAAIAAERPVLVIVDSLIRYQGGAVTQDSSAVQWNAVLGPLATIAHAPGGPAVIVVHHVNAAGRLRDSQDIAAIADLIVEMPKGRVGRRQTLEGIGRIVGVEPYTITIELPEKMPTHRLVGPAKKAPPEAAPLDDGDRELLAVLTEPTRPTAWFEAWKAATGSASKKMFEVRRKKLLAAGAVTLRDGLYAPVPGVGTLVPVVPR